MPSKKPPPPPAADPRSEVQSGSAAVLSFPIVAIGASAGGLQAITDLLKALPGETGMAFVIVQHLSPSHSSMLSEILTRATKMPVSPVEDEMRVVPNHVYVIPPGKNIAIAGGALRISDLETRGQSRPVDHFMRSLAEDYGHQAIGVVLSGTGNDGTVGVEEIKAAGGITFVQDSSAEHSGMPRSAFAAGAVDYVLAPAAIARELARIARHPYVAASEGARLALGEGDLQQVLEALRAATGVDFSNYKRNTLYRRITRRMLLHKAESAREYLKVAQENAAEVEALYQDVLINVTSFFRNPEAFEALKTLVFAKLIDGRTRHDPVRIWVPGCSTGEEAYSIAMAFAEYQEATGKRTPLQVFATDLNGNCVERARAGIYSRGIAQDMSSERLRRFFVEADGSYRIGKAIRDMCVFARQNVLTDPPFSQIDLVSCRNLLIYLEPVLQQKLIPLLHYALRPNGYLWTGSSETIGSYRDLFVVVDAKSKVYQKKHSGRAPVLVPTAPRWANGAPPAAFALREAVTLDPQREADRMLLARYAPPGVVLNGDLEIVQFRGDTSPFLRPAPGKASLNLLKMLREGLMVAVRGAIARARREEAPAREEGLKVRANGGWRTVDVVVMPLKGTSVPPGSMMVIFEEPDASIEARMQLMDAEARAARAAGPAAEGGEKELARLKQELAATRDYLQSVIEQQEAANEELQSANEEVQSANEELQSINEELETSKEEIQSSNEELATVNDELQNRNAELSQNKNDVVNLLSSVQMPIVMLGSDLRIRRFTPSAEKVLNLTAADIGRPVGDVRLGLSADGLEGLLLEVLETVAVREREVQDRQGRWYSMRVRPYRTLENRIDGAVVVLVDIDDLKRAEQAIRESETRFELLANSSTGLVWTSDTQGMRFANRAYEEFVGAKESEIRGSGLARFVHPEDREAYLAAYDEAARGKSPFRASSRMRRADGEYRWVQTVGLPRLSPTGELLGYVGGAFDFSAMRAAEDSLKELDRGKDEFLATLAHELRNPLAGVRNATRLLSATADPAVLAEARAIVERQTAHLQRMIDDILDVSRTTQGKMQLRLEPVDIVAIARRAADATRADREAASQALESKLPDTPVWVRGDAMRLEQVLVNLLGNASRYTPARGRIWFGLERTGNDGKPTSVMIRVRDNGRGIESAALPRIFDLFVQGDSVEDQARSGMGVGLTLAKRIVELHGGEIAAASPGRDLGSEFVVRLPTAPAPAVAGDAQPRRAASRAGGARRILIVDDNRDSAESLRLLLTVGGHEVRVAGDGAGAYAAAREFKPTVVLLDIGLPDIDGYSVARALRAMPEGREARIIAVSGYARDEDVRRGRAAGIDEHLAKPLDPDALEELLARDGR